MTTSVSVKVSSVLMSLTRALKNHVPRTVQVPEMTPVELNDMPGIYGLACDTDGIDGSEDNAGAWLEPGLVKRAAAHGVSVRTALDRRDSYGFFRAADSLIVTGPTRTNVNDYRVILIQ